MLAAAYGTDYLDFDKDQIYQDDPNENGQEGMLRSGDDADQTGTLFAGTEKQVLTLYHQALEALVQGNNQDLDYSLITQNGNAFTAEIVESMKQTATAMGYKGFNDFNPDGWDMGYDEDNLEFHKGKRAYFNTVEDLKAAIDALECKVAEQFDAIKKNPDVDLETEIPKDYTTNPAPKTGF